MLLLTPGLWLLLLSWSFPAAAEQSVIEGGFLLTLAALGVLSLALALTWLSLTRRSRALDAQRQDFQQLLAETPGAIAILDRNLAVRNASSSLKSLLKEQDNSSVSISLPLFADADGQHALDLTLKQQLRQQGFWHGEAWLKNERHCEAFKLSIHTLRQQSSKEPRYMLFGQNITHLRSQSARQQQQVLRDDSTLLPNQLLFTEQLRQAILSCDEHYPSVALLLVQLRTSPTATMDATPDESQLIEAAKRLQLLVSDKLVLARYQSDCFAILVPPHLCQTNSTILLNQLAHKIIAGFRQADPDAAYANLRLAIGISCSPNDGEDATNLINSAERALRLASQQQDHALCFADSGSQQQAPDYLALESELYRSAAQGEFELFYQPKFSISSNRIAGFEALLRWPSPRRGMLPPPTFLPLVEETGLIINLDRLVFRKACKQVSYWQQTALMRGRLALNISAQQFAQTDFIRFMQDTLSEFELSASLFELELPEAIFNHPTIWLRERLHSLERMGFRVLLDNFGDGIASLNQLRQFPLHGVKLAPSLVRYIEQQEQQRNICATLIRLAGYLQLDVIATNIETEMQAYLLHVMGCDCQQGHRFSRAVPAEDIGQLLLKENQLLNNQRQLAN